MISISDGLLLLAEASSSDDSEVSPLWAIPNRIVWIFVGMVISHLVTAFKGLARIEMKFEYSQEMEKENWCVVVDVKNTGKTDLFPYDLSVVSCSLGQPLLLTSFGLTELPTGLRPGQSQKHRIPVTQESRRFISDLNPIDVSLVLKPQGCDKVLIESNEMANAFLKCCECFNDPDSKSPPVLPSAPLTAKQPYLEALPIRFRLPKRGDI